MTDLLTLRCGLCQEPGREVVATVAFIGQDARPLAAVSVRRGPRACEAHVEEVALRAAWSVLKRDVGPRLAEGSVPAGWAVEFASGRRFGGLLQDDALTAG